MLVGNELIIEAPQRNIDSRWRMVWMLVGVIYKLHYIGMFGRFSFFLGGWISCWEESRWCFLCSHLASICLGELWSSVPRKRTSVCRSLSHDKLHRGVCFIVVVVVCLFPIFSNLMVIMVNIMDIWSLPWPFRSEAPHHRPRGLFTTSLVLTPHFKGR